MTTPNFILLDAALMDSEMATARDLNPEHTCLYEGDSERFLGAVAPWLFDFDPESDFAKWMASKAQGNDWGIFLCSVAEPIKVYRHLRKFLIVSTEEGKELYFRFYDPRVLRAFLPTCDRDQLKEFFGPIDAFVIEDENGSLVEYAFANEQLVFSDLKTDIQSGFSSASPTVKEDGRVHAATPRSDFPHPDKSASTQKSDSSQAPKGWDFGY